MNDPAAPTAKRSSVLIVDDNEIHQYALTRALQHADFDVLVAQTGTRALELAHSHKPDVLLLDINLPDVNGFEVCARLKTDNATGPIPIIFHSATSATSAAQSYALALGAAGFLTYPIDTEQLIIVLRGAIARARA